jgi:hypothetical protein
MSGELEPRQADELEAIALRMEEQPLQLLPTTGELVDLRVAGEVARALDEVREGIRRLGELRSLLETVLRLEARRQGTKTLHLAGGLVATVSGGERVEWDIERLAEGLRGAGLPEDRLAQLVVETVEYKVDQRVARQLAAGNPAYAAAIDAARSTAPAPWRVSVKPEAR